MALTAASLALTQGHIVAVRGVGGYHLVCDAGNDKAVMRLRERKARPHKPLAILFPFCGPDGLAGVRSEVELGEAEAEILRSPVRPIVLARRRTASSLSPYIAPGLNELGVMLPYSPLHYLLAKDFAAPLVVTSANISGEPVLTEPTSVERRLGHVADAFLHHDRSIVRPADDPVYRLSAGAMRPLRLGRGCAPLELTLPERLSRPLLAVGAHMKATVALAWEDRVVVSPHIGDMGTQRSLDVFRQLVADLQTLYAVTATAVVCDAHPGYATSRWAIGSGLPVTRVFHHHAHAAALVAEQAADGPWLVFAWDGTGYGKDGTLWGGEALLGTAGHWERKASFRPFCLPGGDMAGREPWRSAAALCWEADYRWDPPVAGTELLRQAWERRLNTPQSSAAGRLFDAAASLTGLLHRASFEGQGPMYLEASSRAVGTALDLPLERDAEGILRSDWAPLLPYLSDVSQPIPERAADFHATLARVILRQAQLIREETGVARVGLTGGVFQNRQLVEQAVRLLESEGFSARLPSRLPCNDAAISYGQVIEYLGSTGTA
jgi:hydrogenase maturation protein HypF